MPQAATWMDAVEASYIRDDHALHCPSISHQDAHGYGYAFNSTLGGKSVAQEAELRTMPLVYESTNAQHNAHDPLSSLPTPDRHLGKNNVLYLDGHLKGVAP